MRWATEIRADDAGSRGNEGDGHTQREPESEGESR